MLFAQEMKQFALSFLVCSFFLGFFQCSVDAGTSDYALMSATPYNSEIALARERLEKFLHKANAKQRAILAQTPIVAVVAAVVEASETGPLYRRMKKGQLGTTGGHPSDKATQPVLFFAPLRQPHGTIGIRRWGFSFGYASTRQDRQIR